MDIGSGIDAWAGSILALMNVPPPEPATTDEPLRPSGLGLMLEHLNVALWTILIAAPAIASMVLLWAGVRWPWLGRSHVWNAVAAISLTLIVALVLYVWEQFSDPELAHLYWAMYASYGLAAVAVAAQFAARRSFSLGRAVGVACAVLALPVIGWTSRLWS